MDSVLLNTIRQNNRIVKVLTNKDGNQVLQLFNVTAQKNMILRIYECPIQAYSVLKSITHPNLPDIYDEIKEGERQFVFEEFVDGITVADIIETGRYTYKGMKKVITGVCEAVSFLHQMGVVHRDIKPENVMVDKTGQVKLIDLNASRRFDAYKSKDTQVLGTIGYASPEQLGIGQCDTRADIYAIGVLINVMLTGEHPSRKLADGKAGKIVLKCTQIDPNSRFQTVDKLLLAL